MSPDICPTMRPKWKQKRNYFRDNTDRTSNTTLLLSKHSLFPMKLIQVFCFLLVLFLDLVSLLFFPLLKLFLGTVSHLICFYLIFNNKDDNGSKVIEIRTTTLIANMLIAVMIIAIIIIIIIIMMTIAKIIMSLIMMTKSLIVVIITIVLITTIVELITIVVITMKL